MCWAPALPETCSITIAASNLYLEGRLYLLCLKASKAAAMLMWQCVLCLRLRFLRHYTCALSLLLSLAEGGLRSALCKRLPAILRPPDEQPLLWYS